MSKIDALAQKIRRIAREEVSRGSRYLETFSVIGTSPLRLRSLSRKLVLSEADGDVEISAAAAGARTGETVYVLGDRHNDYVAIGRRGGAEAGGAVWGYYVPEGTVAYIPEGMFGVIDDGGIDVDGDLEIDGRMVELE